MKFVFSILIFCSLSILSVAQNSSDFFKTTTVVDSSTPEWAVLMYSSNPHVPSVINAYNKFYRENPFVKTVHTQNFKHWVRKAESFLNDGGFIAVPDKLSEDKFLSRLEEKYQNRNAANKVVGADLEWVAMGPFETYKENSTELSKNHKNIYAVDQSESNPDLLICGTEAGGVYKSTDKGVNWSLITKDAVFVGGNTAVKIHPTNEDYFLVASNRRIFLSLDGGLTWTEKYFTDGTGSEFKFHPVNHDTIFHVSTTGLFRSNDGGDNWMQVYSDACYDIDFHPNNADTVYLLKSNASAVRAELFRSDDAGDTWTLKDNDWYSPADAPNASEGGGKIGVTPASPDLIYVCLIGASKSGDDGWIGIYQSDDKGENWTDPDGQDGGPYGAINGASPWNVAAYSGGYHQGFYNFDMEVSANDPDKLWVATIRLAESSDGGASFQSIGAANSLRFAEVHADVQDIEVIGNDIWVATDGGLNYSNDELLTQTVLHKGIQASHFWGFNTGWNEDTYVGGKYHDGTTGWFEDYGLGKAHHIGGVEEATGYVDPINSRKLLYRTHYSSPNTSVKTIPKVLGDPVINHASFPLRANEAYTLGQSSGVYYDYRYSNHIYIGRDNKIYKSTNGGISFDVLYSFANPNSMVYELEISRSNPDVMYCILNPDGGYWTEDEVWKSTDGGESWVRTDNFSGNRRRMFITINPSDEDEVWICQANGANGTKVQRTTDGGTSWTNMTTPSLDEEPIRDILFQGGTNGIVYVAGVYDLFYWDDMTSDWVNYSQGLPLIVRSLRLNPFYRDGELRLGTGGRGVWARAMEDTLFSPIAQAITYSDSIFCAQDTVQFECYSILKHEGASWDWSIDPTPDYISSTSARNPKVVFGQNGSYDVTLSITDGKGDMDSKTWTNMVAVESLCDVDTIPGDALSLSGIYNSYANIPALDLNTNTLTITAWIRADGNQNDWAGIVFSRDGSTTAGINIGTNNQLRYHWNGGNWGWNSGHTVPLGEWTHIALVVEANRTVIYMNGIPSTHVTTNNIEEFNGVTRIGADSHSSGRRFIGEIDEVCIWDRALDMNEIRELRHLTKEDVIDDLDLIAYYQFNEGKGEIAYDRSGNGYHASLKSENITRVTSDAPIGGGLSHRQRVDAQGSYYFGDTGVEMQFPSGAVYPDGDLVVSRINMPPNVLPNANDHLNYYWIINNYGANDVFTALEEIRFLPHDRKPSIEAINDPSVVQLHKRGDNEYLSNWSHLCNASSVSGGANPHFSFDNTCNLTSFSQFLLTSNDPQTEILPVELLSFEAQLMEDDKAELKWITATEINLDRYDIEHSLDGIDFKIIGSVIPPSPNSREKRNYTFDHEDIYKGNNYYRLKIVDLDGKFEYSRIEVVSVNEEDEQAILVYPNPVDNKGELIIDIGDYLSGRMQIYDASGKQVKDVILQNSLSKISMEEFSKGPYFYSVITDGKILNGHLVVK